MDRCDFSLEGVALSVLAQVVPEGESPESYLGRLTYGGQGAVAEVQTELLRIMARLPIQGRCASSEKTSIRSLEMTIPTSLPTPTDSLDMPARAEDALGLFRAAIDALPDMVYLADFESMRFIYVNEAACRSTGYSLAEHLRICPWELVPNTSQQGFRRQFDKVAAMRGESLHFEFTGRGKDGTWGYVETYLRALQVGGRTIMVATSRSITERKLAQQAADRSARMYATLSATNEAIVQAVTPVQLFEDICQVAVREGGFTTAAVVVPGPQGRGEFAAVCGEHVDTVRKAPMSFDESTTEGRGLTGTAFRERKAIICDDFQADERTRLWHDLARRAKVMAAGAFPLLGEQGCLGVLVLYSSDKRAFDEDVIKLLERMARNLSFALHNIEREVERKHDQERIRHLASHDALTGLPNRMMFSELLNRTLASAKRYHRSFAVMFVDLDRFKQINDTYGHAAGDELLRVVASRLAGCMRTSDVVARLGGDEFVVLVNEVEGRSQVEAVARKMLAETMQPVILAGDACTVTGSVGISMFHHDADDEQGLMTCADMAMYQAKRAGKNQFCFYRPALKD